MSNAPTPSPSPTPSRFRRNGHGLFPGQPAPSKADLLAWLDSRGAVRSSKLELADMEDGSGWRVVATDDIDPATIILSVPKPTILSVRTTSLPPILGLSATRSDRSETALTTLHLALVLLHEMRLGPDSAFWGYVQSLPRVTPVLPVFWDDEGLAGADGRRALRWLSGTEAWRDLRDREAHGQGLADLRSFYNTHSSRLPPTRLHPEPSPFAAFCHAYSLVSTRAFVVDFYHMVALCPLADAFNHSSIPHTSLATDEFVCHRCGSLAMCAHDIPDRFGVPARLEHLTPRQRDRISKEDDNVEMVTERPVITGEEVFNTYGEGLGDAQLLVQWGYTNDEFAGDGLSWTLPELCPNEEVQQVWSTMGDGLAIATELFGKRLREWGEDDEVSLFCPPVRKPQLFTVSNSGQVSSRLFAALHLSCLYVIDRPESREEAEQQVVEAARGLERMWDAIQNEEDEIPTLEPAVLMTARAIRAVLSARLKGMHHSEYSIDELYKRRDALSARDAPLQRMVLGVVMNERQLLATATNNWNEIIDACTVLPGPQ